MYESITKQIFQHSATDTRSMTTVTIGTVVDTNDPQQMGRIRVVCPQWGDSWQHNYENMPWAIYVSPFGGQVSTGTRGPGIQQTNGGVSYGLWSIPKVGSQVVVICLDGDPMYRAYIGCIYDMFTPHTLPHGRWISDTHPELDKSADSFFPKDTPVPKGPYSSGEHLIQPLADNLKKSFGNTYGPEWMTRAADYSASALSVDKLHHTFSKVQDDNGTKVGDWTVTQGYQSSRIDPFAPSDTGKNGDSQVTAITSAGFHAISMDDRQENCRIRVRTSAGHQIIMDDTNERVYIATAEGNNWIELDQAGNIDIYASGNVSMHSNKTINLNADESIRMYAKQGIHMISEQEIRLSSVQDTHITTSQNMRLNSLLNTYIQSNSTMHIKSKDLMSLYTEATLNIKAGGQILQTGSEIHLNGPTAATATNSNAKASLYTNRIPQHEPWARMMTKKDNAHDLELPANDPKVGRYERGQVISRGMYWRR